MAQITMNFDTKTKKLGVTVNGQTLSNVNHISVYRGHDENDQQTYVEIAVETSEVDMDEEIAKRVVFLSRGSAEASKALASGTYIEHSKLPDMIGIVEVDPVIGEVGDYLSQKWGH